MVLDVIIVKWQLLAIDYYGPCKWKIFEIGIILAYFELSKSEFNIGLTLNSINVWNIFMNDFLKESTIYFFREL